MHENTTRFIPPARRTRIALAVSLALGAGMSVSAVAAPTVHEPTGDWAAYRAELLQRARASGYQPKEETPQDFNLAATIPVSNCNNSGAGSLRAAVEFANSGDIIDLSGLTCSIQLNSSIVTAVDSLTIRGNPDTKYAISGRNNVRPITHNGTGTLTLVGVGIGQGRVIETGSTTARGGCIFSKGNVRLRNSSRVQTCRAENTGGGNAEGGAVYAAGWVEVNEAAVRLGQARTVTGIAAGGGIYAGGDVDLSLAQVSSNIARGSDALMARGGGIHSGGSLTAKYSTIADNEVTISASGLSSGGGAWVAKNNNTIRHSTISGNRATGASGLLLAGLESTGSSLVELSTIANNKATASSSGWKYGGALAVGGTTAVRGCTISGNTERNESDEKYGAGVRVRGGANVTMTSNIVGGNFLVAADESKLPSDMASNGFVTIAGSHNLVDFYDVDSMNVPDDTLSTVMSGGPKLGPLADNGGPTWTIALQPGSPAINAGTTTGLMVKTVDQRGSGFPRVVGPSADIGAYEFNDVIFANGFD